MKYIVRKELPGAKVGDILKVKHEGDHARTDSEYDDTIIIDSLRVKDALDQGFIEPYEEKPKRWRAKAGHNYFYICHNCEKGLHVDYTYHSASNLNEDAERHKLGNYFKSKETAEAVAEALKLFFEYLHDPKASELGLGRKDSTGELGKSMDSARKLVLADNEVSDE